jgi:malate dehydrogenase (quinone)
MPQSLDVLVIGSGILSATVAVMLKQVDPTLQMHLVEATTELANEASNAVNNAGTGHAGLCELSYTPQRSADGSVPLERALKIYEQFEQSKQFWSELVARRVLSDPSEFIHPVPHLCFLTGQDGVSFLRARHEAMITHHFFSNMQWTDDPIAIQSWVPLVMEGRAAEPIAITRGSGTEINYGRLASQMCQWLSQQEGCGITRGWRVGRMRRVSLGWEAELRCVVSGETRRWLAQRVFVGAGGGSLPFLQATGLPEFRGLAGFPIAGQWLVCDAPDLACRHNAKVYGATPTSAPSLGAGHLDSRRIDGRPQLMFGPFASWTTRFLKQTGHWSDLPRSLRLDNVTALLRAGVHNRSLVGYLIAQALQSHEQRMQALRAFYPRARAQDWRLVQAGIRVQTIKQADRGAIYFGTEVVASRDRTLSAVLGASPGASVAVSVAQEILQRNWPHLLTTAAGQRNMKRLIPTYDQDLKLAKNAGLFNRVNRGSAEILGLTPPEKCFPS